MLAAALVPSARATDDDDPLPAMIRDLAPPKARAALERIPEVSRKLLALRSYLRMGRRLEKRWSWTEAEIKAYQDSDEQTDLLVAIDAVSAHFAAANPGYELYTNTRVRSLDLQIQRWNSNKSVGVAAEELLNSTKEKFGLVAEPPEEKSEGDACEPPEAAAAEAMGETDQHREGAEKVATSEIEPAASGKESKAEEGGETCDDPAAIEAAKAREQREAERLKKLRRLTPKRMRAWLAGFKPAEPATLAAPGLSLHGQARAVDFQIKKNGKIIAGASSSGLESVWRGADRWDKKLKASVVAASPAFAGPLVRPDEPWHYNYDPDAPIKVTPASEESFANESTRSEPVKFGEGVIRATFSGRIKGREITDYVFAASSGQKIRISISDNGTPAHFNVLAPGEDTQALFVGSLKGNVFERVLKVTGIYKIRVYLSRAAVVRGKSADFKVELAISAK